MKTHKNPGLRSGPAPFKPAPAPKPSAHGSQPKPVAAAVAPAASHAPGPATRAGASAAAAKKPPVLELQGKKWAVVSTTAIGSRLCGLGAHT